MRRLPIWLVLSTGACAGALTVIACSSETTKPSSLEVEDDDGGRTKRDTGTTSSSGGSSGGSSGDPGDLDGATANGRIYAHTPDKLFLFEPNNAGTHARIAHSIEKALAQWEPRISVAEVDVAADPQAADSAIVTITYKLVASGAAEKVSLSIPLGARA